MNFSDKLTRNPEWILAFFESFRNALVRIGIVVLAVAIIAAVLTPTPDVFNMSLMGLPLYLLFEIGLIGMRLGKK